MEDENLQLQLGDIIQVDAPTNEKLDQNIFLVTYIDNKQIEIQDIESLKKTSLLLDADGELEDESINSISLLSRDPEEGYARQHGLLPKVWVTVTLGGDLPAIFSGEITNLEEDMIEIMTFPEKETIYIDFAYKGIPKDIPIKSIEIRDPPDLEIIDEQLEPGEIPVTPPDEGAPIAIPIPETRKEIKQIIIQADEITFGPDMGEITQDVALDETYERYGIQTQTNDLLDELLSTIPNAKRTTKVLNNIHLMIERFKELRHTFSQKDEYGNPTQPIVKMAGYKPLVEVLKNFSKKLNWIIPIVKNKKKVYDVDEDEADMVDDIIPMTMAQSQIADTEALDQYTNNTIPDSENKYDYMLKTVQEIGTPYEAPSVDGDDFITKKEVEANLDVIVDNLDDLYSSVVSKETLARKRYLIAKYNLGFNKLETVIEQGSKPYNKLVRATPANKLYLKSFILLPEENIRHSRVSLPGSSILVKSSLNQQKMYYYKRFKKDTSVNTQVVESFDNPIQHNFIESATEILLDDSLEDDPNKYEKYLQAIIPRTRVLFGIIKKYIDQKLTLSEVVKELEPFLIYSDDLTYKQYREMVSFIKSKISDYKKTYVARARDFRNLQAGKKYADKTWFSLFNILGREKKTVLENGYGLTMRGFTSSENYHRIMDLDNGNLFMTALALETLQLMTPVDINEIFKRQRLENTDEEVSNPKNNSECSNRTLVKRYLDLDALLDDNDKTIYVDKNLDQTRYDIIKEYDSERESMEPMAFYNFLKDKLIKNVGLSEYTARKDAEAMIRGKREVEEGEYASLVIDNGEKTYYYMRKNNQWERDESIPDVGMNESEFCNMSKPCIKVKEDCVNNEIAEGQTNNKALDSLIKEFHVEYEVSKEELSRLIENRFAYFSNRIQVLKNLRFDEKTKYSDRDYKLGLDESAEEEIRLSPYTKLRDMILGQGDMVKRNSDILRLYTMFMRDAIIENGEDPNWLYCIETNKKLLPMFIYILAVTFNENQYNYVKVLDNICAKQGKLSDDGNAWVDEHSGYVIKQVSFDTDEGYEDTGFKAVSREVIQDELRAIRATEIERKFSDPNAEKINNVIQSLASYMGFSVEQIQEFVIRNTLLVTGRIVPSETEYNKKREAVAKKGKKIPDYETAYNTSMMLVTFVYFFVGIQVSIPSIKTRKQFPGCKKSFEGYPLDGSGDDSGIQYVACIANKIKSSVAPWSSIKKMNSTGIAKRMKDIINKYVIPDAIIQTRFNEKRAYMAEEKDSDIPVELDISKWQTFLPPLVRITITPRDEITDEFKAELIANIKSGKTAQQKQISILQGSLIHYPMVMIEEIQKVIQKEEPLLTNLAQEAFLENACCIDDDEETTINYFMNRIPSLRKYNTFVKEIHSIYHDIMAIALAPRLFSPINTRRIYPKLSTSFSKKTIYQAIIHYCRFGTLFPVPENLQAVCLTKPENFSLFDSLKTQIEKLEGDGKNYSLEDLNRLLDIVNRENIVPVSLYDTANTSLDQLRSFLNDDVGVLPKKLNDILTELVDSFNISVDEPTSEMKKVINYLDSEILDKKTNLISFLQRNNKMAKRKFNNIIEVLQTMTWEGDSKEQKNINSVQNLKNQIHELTQVFPNMILNEVYYDDVNFPSHWTKTLSKRHISDLRNIIYSYYNTLSKFYGKKTLIPMLKHMTDKTAMWRDFISVLPVFEQLEKTNEGLQPSFNSDILLLILQYSYLSCLELFVKQVEEVPLFGIPSESTEGSGALEITTIEEVVNEEIGNISEMDIISGEKLERSEIMSEFLLEILAIFGNTKKLLNYTYDDVIYRVNVSKEKEKDQFTKRLKDLSDEEREIENLMKNHKLGVWSKGLSKGVTQYERDTYDDERREMERIIALENKIGNQDFVSDMNRDIFLSEAQEASRIAAQIDAEESRIDYMGEDADFEDMGMDGDEMY